MKNRDRTKAELIEEISRLNRRIRQLEKSETEPKPAEKVIHQYKSYLSAIIGNHQGLVRLKDTESRFLSVNQVFVISCGKQNSEDLIGKTDMDIWPAELAEKYRLDDLMIMKKGKPAVTEEPILSLIRAKSGGLRCVRPPYLINRENPPEP